MRVKNAASGWTRRAGKVAVLVALALPTILIPVLALGVDGAVLMEDRRRLQAGVDAAALAAARRLWSDNLTHYRTSQAPPNTADARTAALASLDARGFTTGVCASRVVNIPATSSNPRLNGAPGTIEVVVTFNQSRAFSRLWGTSKLPVMARVVSRVKNLAQGSGIIILEESDNQALYGHGSGKLLVNEAGVAVNSTAPNAAFTNGTSIVLAARSFDVTGGYGGTGYYQTPYPASGPAIPYTGVPPVPDPLAGVPEPVASNYAIQNAPNGSPQGTITLQPGRYKQRLRFEADETVVLMPGIYYLEKGISLLGTAQLSGTGVMIYNAGSGNAENINLAGSGSWSLTPPTSGPYAGISLFQSRLTANEETTMELHGNGGAGMTGTIYAPTTKVLVTGDGVQTLGSQYISRTLEMAGSGIFTIDWTAPKAKQPPVIELVE